jgi:hypothetical protein
MVLSLMFEGGTHPAHAIFSQLDWRSDKNIRIGISLALSLPLSVCETAPAGSIRASASEATGMIEKPLNRVRIVSLLH